MSFRIHTSIGSIEHITASSILEMQEKLKDKLGDDIRIVSFYMVSSKP